MGKLGKFYRKQCRYWDGDESFYDSSEGKQQWGHLIESNIFQLDVYPVHVQKNDQFSTNNIEIYIYIYPCLILEPLSVQKTELFYTTGQDEKNNSTWHKFSKHDI